MKSDTRYSISERNPKGDARRIARVRGRPCPPNHPDFATRLLLSFRLSAFGFSLFVMVVSAVDFSVRAGTNMVSSVPTPAYRLQVQDTLLYSVREDPVPPAEPMQVYVNAQGKAHFPVSAGFDQMITLQASGKTLAQLQTELRRELLDQFYEEASVNLKLKQSKPRVGKVLFYGAVRGNFLQLLPGETNTIFEGVYRVGVTEYANLNKVKLSRMNARTGQLETRTINLNDIKKGDRQADIPLEDGDRIEVPEKSLVF